MHQPFLALLRDAEQLSNCSRRKVTCIIVRGGEVAAISTNGSRFPEGCQRPAKKGNCGCVHAEVNAALAYRQMGTPDSAYISAAPCELCAKVLANLGVRDVYYLEDSHPMLAGFAVLDAAGIRYTKLASE